MFALCLFAILACVQCAPREYSDMNFSNFYVKPIIETFTGELYKAGNDMGNSANSDTSKITIRYAFAEDSSSDFRSYIATFLGYVEKNTCLEFVELPNVSNEGVGMVFKETEETKGDDCAIDGIMISGPKQCAKKLAEYVKAGGAKMLFDDFNAKYCS